MAKESNKPRRDLKLSSPHMHGEDVKALQKALNAHTARYRKKYRAAPKAVTVDARYGRMTREAYRWVGYYVVGFLDTTLDKGATLHAQELIRDTSGLSKIQRKRAHERQKKLTKVGSVDAVLKEERKYVGKHESGHNRSGPGFPVDVWEREVGLLGEPYCGIAQTYFIRHFGGVPVPSLAYTPNIYAWGHGHQNGLRVVSWAERQPGDLVLYKWAGVSNDVCDHVGMLDSDRTHTIEFNTSPGDGGSQNNGGGCYRRDRGTANVVAVVRVEALH
jgi:hypothetical protein